MRAQVTVGGLSCLLTADKNNIFIVLKYWNKDLATPMEYIVFSWKSLKLFMQSYTKTSASNSVNAELSEQKEWKTILGKNEIYFL